MASEFTIYKQPDLAQLVESGLTIIATHPLAAVTIFCITALFLVVLFAVIRTLIRNLRFRLWDWRGRKALFRTLQFCTFLGTIFLGTANFWQLEPGTRDASFFTMVASFLMSPLWWGLVIFTFLLTFQPHLWFDGPILTSDDEKIGNSILRAMTEAKRQLKYTNKKCDLTHVWDHLMRAAALEVQQKLNLKHGIVLKANLIFADPADGNRPDGMTVVSRSENFGDYPMWYPVNSSKAAYQAMVNNQTLVADVVDIPGKLYKCVVATPICTGTQAFGAITVDALHEEVFTGKNELVDVVLRKYTGIVLLTLPNNSSYYTCEKRA